MASVIISSLLIILLMISVRLINSCVDEEKRARTLNSLVFKVDGILADAVGSVTVVEKAGSECTSQHVQLMKNAVQVNGYIRSLTLFDSSGNIYCSSSTGQGVIPSSLVNNSVRGEIRNLNDKKTTDITLRIISGSTRVPDKNALVIFIPVSQGIMTVAIDAGYFITPLSTIYLVSHRIFAFETDGRQLTWNGLSSDFTRVKNDYQKESAVLPFKIVELTSDDKQSVYNKSLSAIFFAFVYISLIFSSKWLLNRIYSRRRYILEALRNRAFSFDIQPVFSLTDKRLVGGEVLIRWRLNPPVCISPHLFIPVAENNNIVNKLAEFLLTDIADRISGGSLTLPTSFRLNFNIHSSHFEQESLISACRYFMELTATHKIKLVLELTERQELGQQNTVRNNLERLIALGVEMAVDDFGTGSSGLRYLYNCHFRCIKMDRSLTEEAMLNPLARTVMESSIRLAQKLGKAVVVEGIETQQQLELIRRMNLENEVWIQGYLWSRPLNLQQLGDFIPRYA